MTPASEVRLLLSDVDGTLVTDDRVLTPRAVQAVHRLRAVGIQFALTSSRPPRGMQPLIKPLSLTLPLAGLNGGVLVNPDLSVLETHPLDPRAARQIVDLLASVNLDVWIYTDTDWFISRADGPQVARETKILGFDPVVISSYDERQISKAIKIVGVSEDKDLIASGEAALNRQFGSTIGATRSEPYFIDVTSPEANKGLVAVAFARRLKLEVSEIATIGDMPNDVLMFKKSGVSIAMGNASPEVKAAAGHVTTSNNDEGFAKAVEDMFLSPLDVETGTKTAHSGSGG